MYRIIGVLAAGAVATALIAAWAGMPTSKEAAASHYLAAVCEAGDAADYEAVWDADGFPAITAAAARGEDSARGVASRLSNPSNDWPVEIASDVALVAEMYRGEAAAYDALSRSATIGEALLLPSFAPSDDAIAADKRIRAELGIPDAGCETSA